MFAFKKYLNAAHCFYACIAAEECQGALNQLNSQLVKDIEIINNTVLFIISMVKDASSCALLLKILKGYDNVHRQLGLRS